MGRQPRFDVADLADAGLRLVRDRDWSAVSIAAVATELGVTPMALYRLASDGEHLKRLIADAAGQSLQPVVGGASLLNDLRAWAVITHDRLGELSGLSSYVIQEWTELPCWLAIVETFLAHAADEGLVGSRAVHTVNAVFSYTLARAQLSEGLTRHRRLLPLDADAARFPHLRTEQRHFRVAQSETAFRFGLDALVAGLATSTEHARIS